jgi:DNA (cytosine-5)-methyltransferase 1
MHKKQIIFRLAELFCGPGGLALGAKSAFVSNENYNAKIVPVWANDINPDACKTYIRNIHPDNPSAVVCKPVQEIDLKNLPNFDAFAYGFPCNDFSVVGEQKGINGTYGPLYSYGVKILSIHNPKWFMAENVSGIQNANDGLTFQKILKELECAGEGYRITVNLYKFEEYGVPQYRHRIVIVGIRKDLNLEFKVPAPCTKFNHVSSRDAIMIPPIKKDAYNNELTKQSNLVIERLKYIPSGENAWYEGIPEHLRLSVSGAKLSQIYKRLDPNKPAYTITGSGGGGTHGYHWKENRALTNRERARLQTFPDSYIFDGLKESVRQQIGMAVPPKGAQIIFESILKTFLNITYDAIKPSIINGTDKKQLGLFD